jgi:hypothetical protein
VEFRITLHSGTIPPANALDLLWQRLGPQRDEVSFTRLGEEIRATPSGEHPVSMTWDERAEIGRRAVLELVCAACEPAADLESDWFAVSPGR